MALVERDVNATNPSNSPAQNSTVESRCVAGENAAPSPRSTSSKDTANSSSQNRFKAPTKASTAKTSSAPFHQTRLKLQSHVPVASLQKHPRLSPHSTPNSPQDLLKSSIKPPISKWNANTATKGPSMKETAITPVHTTRSPAVTPVVSRPDTVANIDKPLPARPFATMANTLSPSKDSRTLMDASEKPLQVTLGGSRHDWPALAPSPVSTPKLTNAEDFGQSPSARLAAGAASMFAAASHFTNAITGAYSPQDSQAQSSPSVGKGDDPHVAAHGMGPTTELHQTDPSHRSNQHTKDNSPPRKSSLPRLVTLRNKPSMTDLNSPLSHSAYRDNAVSDFGLEGTDESRTVSPSLTSFSRPRPSSLSQSPSAASLSSSYNNRPAKTASRIPLPDSKKATLVEIKPKHSSPSPADQSDNSGVLTFGEHSIDSPDPSQVLDNGTRRRELKMRNDALGMSAPYMNAPNTVGSGKYSSLGLSRSKASSPEGTVGTSEEEDEEEVATPTDYSMPFAKHGHKPRNLDRSSRLNAATEDYGETLQPEFILGRPPPSNSPYTIPLQTIHSSSLLPLVEDRDFAESELSAPRLTSPSRPADYAAFARRLTEIEATIYPADQQDTVRGSLMSSHSRYDLIALLRGVEKQEEIVSTTGGTGLDSETKLHLNRTLSMLEGDVPLDTSTDNPEFAELFENLRLGFQRAPRSDMVGEDTMPAGDSDGSSDYANVHGTQANTQHFDDQTPATRRDARSTVDFNASRQPTGPIEVSHWSRQPTGPAEISQWSYSSSSGNANSAGKREDSTSIRGLGNDAVPLGPPLGKRSTRDVPYSIGYPSSIPRKASHMDLRSKPASSTRQSSPTLGRPLPGSVRHARENMTDRVLPTPTPLPELQRPKQNERIPSAGPSPKALSILGHHERGRLPSSDHSKKGRTVSKKLPRPRSKSRYVLEKINGLFSGKRDKRTSAMVPPTSSISTVPEKVISRKASEVTTNDRDLHVTAGGSPVLRRNRSGPGPLTKMPTYATSLEVSNPAMRSAVSLVPSAPLTPVLGDFGDRASLQALSESLVGKAQKETNPAKKQRLLSFAKVLTDSIISAREAQISAETAQAAARSARMSHEMTLKSVQMLQRLAASLNKR